MLPKRYFTYKGKTQPLLHWALELGCSTHSIWLYAEKYGNERAIEEFIKSKEKRELKEKLFSHVRS